MKRSENPECNSSRRRFAKSLAAIAATPIIMRDGAALEAIAQTQSQEAPSPLAEALTQAVRANYGKNLTEEQLNEVKQSINGRLRSADALKKITLANGDEPDFVFSADLR